MHVVSRMPVGRCGVRLGVAPSASARIDGGVNMKKTARATLAAGAGGALLAATLVALPATTAVASETE